MNIKQLNERLIRLLESVIPADAKMVSEGPGASAYILEKNLKRGTKYQVYWDLYDYEEKGGIYKTREEAYDEIINDFLEFDSWEEVQESCSFYDENLKNKVYQAFARDYNFVTEGNKIMLQDEDGDFEISLTRTEKGFDVENEDEGGTLPTAQEAYDYLQQLVDDLKEYSDNPCNIKNEITVEEIQNLPIGTNESKNENLISNRRFRLQKEQNKKVKRLFGKQNKYQED